ncbi:MAG: hypothetical protein FAF04_06820 [Epsilonproteobacteria bacterium]|nr:hypothetical protein [Campylobacterota bacterium]
MILYQFAYGWHGKIVDIGEAIRYESYTCIGCGARLVPKKGLKNAHHFSHLNKKSTLNQKHNCSPEHYIHKAAKELFFSSFKEKKSFLLTREIEYICINKIAIMGCSKVKTEAIDLQANYQSVEIEKKDGDFIPDILLSNSSGEKLYIEFAYTHRSSKKKDSKRQ